MTIKKQYPRRFIARLYLTDKEKLAFKSHAQKYGYVSDCELLRIAVKEKMAKDKKTSSV